MSAPIPSCLLLRFRGAPGRALEAGVTALPVEAKGIGASGRTQPQGTAPRRRTFVRGTSLAALLYSSSDLHGGTGRPTPNPGLPAPSPALKRPSMTRRIQSSGAHLDAGRTPGRERHVGGQTPVWLEGRATNPRPNRARAFAFVAVLLGLAIAGPAAAQTGVIRGQVVDSTARMPVRNALVMLVGTSRSATTDSEGRFELGGLSVGTAQLRISHLAYGERTIEVEVGAEEPSNVRLTLTPTAITMERLDVDVMTAQELRQRSMGTRDGRITREEIAAVQNANMTLADVLRRYVPTIRVRRQENIAGNPICVELRTIRVSGVQPPCLSPAVYLDGVPVTNPTLLYGSLNLETVESLEVIPAAESGVRYGSGALYGALLIETRRPGGPERSQPRPEGLVAFDWTTETRPHPSSKTFGFAFVGNVLGLTLGLVAANQCIGLRYPAEDSIVTRCETMPTVASAAGAILLPALGGAVGARLGGSTELTRGQLLPATLGAVMAIVPGYALAITSERQNSDVVGVLAVSLLTLGVPFTTTVADRLFRSFKD